MKIRSSFVSNSSSSSYIIRGIKIDVEEAKKLINPEVLKKAVHAEDYDNTQDAEIGAVEDVLWRLAMDNKLSCHHMQYYFRDQIDNDPNKDKFVLGLALATLNDGEWTEIPEPNRDLEITNNLKKLAEPTQEYGIIAKPIKTYACYISNDNY